MATNITLSTYLKYHQIIIIGDHIIVIYSCVGRPDVTWQIPVRVSVWAAGHFQAPKSMLCSSALRAKLPTFCISFLVSLPRGRCSRLLWVSLDISLCTTGVFVPVPLVEKHCSRPWKHSQTWLYENTGFPPLLTYMSFRMQSTIFGIGTLLMTFIFLRLNCVSVIIYSDYVLIYLLFYCSCPVMIFLCVLIS